MDSILLAHCNDYDQLKYQWQALDNKQLEKEFYNRIMENLGIIRKVCRMYCDDGEHRKDLFQEILLQLWKSYPTFRGQSQFSTLMYRVALNVSIQDMRKTKRERGFFIRTNTFKEPCAETETDTSKERLKTLRRAISGLNKVEKAIVLLHLEEKSNAEIAEIMGITPNHVRVKMNRIKKKLTKTIKDRYHETF